MKRKNLVGPQIRKLRCARGWSQEQLAVKLQILGWDVSRSGVGKVEAQIARVIDQRLLYFAAAFHVEVADLYPKVNRDGTMFFILENLLARRSGTRSANARAAPVC
jgi:transcriptional regulator with XRE-family HTH domain